MCLQSDKYVLPKNKRTTVLYMHQIVKYNRGKITFNGFNHNGNQFNVDSMEITCHERLVPLNIIGFHQWLFPMLVPDQ